MEEKFLVISGKVVRLSLWPMDELWHDDEGTIWALKDGTASVDPIDRCGVGAFSLDASSPLTAACKVHDFMYSSPTYQLFHTREEADRILRSLIRKSGVSPWYKLLAEPFYLITEWFGSGYWENKKTR